MAATRTTPLKTPVLHEWVSSADVLAKRIRLHVSIDICACLPFLRRFGLPSGAASLLPIPRRCQMSTQRWYCLCRYAPIALYICVLRSPLGEMGVRLPRWRRGRHTQQALGLGLVDEREKENLTTATSTTIPAPPRPPPRYSCARRSREGRAALGAGTGDIGRSTQPNGHAGSGASPEGRRRE